MNLVGESRCSVSVTNYTTYGILSGIGVAIRIRYTECIVLRGLSESDVRASALQSTSLSKGIAVQIIVVADWNGSC